MADLLIRREIRALSKDAALLKKLRVAYQKLQAKQGASGYQDLAGIHGLPQNKCPHHSTLFLPWHRAYLISFEKALREIDPDVHLAFWDWASKDSIKKGVPDAFSAATFKPNGSAVPNPLKQALLGPLNQQTFRNPRAPSVLKGFAQQVDDALTRSQFLQFTSDIEGPHDNLHVWFRNGSMGSVPTAAYDPIFWSHHANVDRQWAKWQRQNPQASVPANLLNVTLDPFGMTVAQVLDHRAGLNYDYEGLEAVPHLALVPEGRGLFSARITPRKQRTFLRVYDIGMSRDTITVDIFVNQPDADHNTAIEGNQHFAGSFGIFGMGDLMPEHEGMHAHGAAHELMQPKQQSVDITDAVKKVVPKGGEVKVKLVATRSDGQPVDVSAIPMKAMSIEVR